jgi:hypothetical protein
VESDRSGGDDPDEATSDVSIAVLDVNDTRPSGLRRGRRVLRGAPSDTRDRLVQAMRSANVRADAIVFNSALSAYAHTRPPLWKPARQLPRDMPTCMRAPSGPDGMVALWRRPTSSGPRCSTRRAPPKRSVQAVWLVCSASVRFVRVSACVAVGASSCALSLLLEHGVFGDVFGHEPLSVCEAA